MHYHSPVAIQLTIGIIVNCHPRLAGDPGRRTQLIAIDPPHEAGMTQGWKSKMMHYPINTCALRCFPVKIMRGNSMKHK